jgi:uncharacterized repeat protein (TIGR01451 family)
VAPEPQAVAAIPAAAIGESVISVSVGGLRDTQSNAVSPVPGVWLRLYDGASATQLGAVVNDSWGRCETDADGDCSFVIPDTAVGGANRDRRFWIVRDTTEAAPAGYFDNTDVVTSTDGATYDPTQYRVRTGTLLRSGVNYASSTNFMINAATPYTSSGVWPMSLDNPPFPDKCGLNVALVLDLSGSVFEAGAQGALKQTAGALTQSLVGTPSQVALYTFGSIVPAPSATASPGSNDNRPLTPVSTQEGADTVIGWINGLTQPNPGQATNWDRALFQVAQSPQRFDVVLVLTDGNPTRYGPFTSGGTPLGTGIQTRFVEIEHSIFSANAVKNQGTKIIAVGLGDGISGAAYNLEAISGPIEGTDYYQADWANAATVLANVALHGCSGSLTVVKQVLPEGSNDLTQAVPAGGWEFAVTGTGATFGSDTAAALTTQAGTGAESTPFELAASSSTFTVAETVQTHYELYPVNGFNAQCTRLDTGAAVATTTTTDGFTVPIADPSEMISCVVYNRALPTAPPPATLTVTKKWVINQVESVEGPGPYTPLKTETFADPAQPGLYDTPPSDFSAGLAMSNDSALYDGLVWGVEYGGLTEGGDWSVVEDPEYQGYQKCKSAGAVVTAAKLGDAGVATVPNEAIADYDFQLGAGANTLEITNTVNCATLLSLYKLVQKASLNATFTDPSQLDTGGDKWLLTATPMAADALPGPTGRFDYFNSATYGNTVANVTPGVAYVLAESEGDPAYWQYSVPEDLGGPHVAGSTGSWLCLWGDPIDDQFQFLSEGLYGAITVPYGRQIDCIALNYTAELTVTKVVSGGSATPADWTFSATPEGDPGDLGVPPPASTGVASGEAVHLLPHQDYTISEDDGGPSGYALRGAVCRWDGEDGVEHHEYYTGNPTLMLGLAASADCAFTNDPVTEVSLTKTSSLTAGTNPAVGSEFEFELTAKNSGANPAYRAEVTDSVPSGLRVVSVQMPSGWIDQSSGNQLDFVMQRPTVEDPTDAPFNPGSAVFTVTVEVTNPIPQGSEIVNRACVAASNDQDPSNNCGSTIVPPRPPDPREPDTPTPPNTGVPSSPATPPDTPVTTPPASPSATPSKSTTPPQVLPTTDPARPGTTPGRSGAEGAEGLGNTGADGIQSLGLSAFAALLTGAILLLIRRRALTRPIGGR